MQNTIRDFVQREVVINGAIDRVFAAITDPATYPTWGPVKVEGALVPGETPILDFGVSGRVAVHVMAVDSPSYFAYRWAQGQTDPEKLVADPLTLPNTLVEFHLEAFEEGTKVKVVESGLSQLPGLAPEAAAPMEAGWGLMLGALVKALEGGDTGVTDSLETVVLFSVPPSEVFDRLTHPDKWWAEKVEGTMAVDQTVTMDFGQFGMWKIEISGIEEPSYFAYKRLEITGMPLATETVVEFFLEPTATGTQLRQVERGFDQVPEDSRETAFRTAQQGWSIILGLLEHHFAQGG